ncbi:phosphoglycolate phosphatase [Sulfodiicoccus acidiphilus]|uniref:Phosphoglycolate phosphatase n=1 Tax=Sulfodiicoccus acidiphilus TaxID=1670455 RepID=A0A348B6W1_9CREN|nr:phosphoglycolate phosphatase [Sulfodiicoccus acidiphilus]BBD73913.1 phosphoglycolate phosphatase [Sulfodiicoccus acidiphilus]GGU03443.1 phosphoglycolate phosphatase [Sulfodiicoccus acidiphilus]
MIRLILADVDGTLTEDRDTYRLDLDAVAALRLAEKMGIKVGLVSGNSYPVLRGLHQYMGLSGGVVAENGCVVYLQHFERLCEKLERKLAQEFSDTFGLAQSWQNPYRESDYAFYLRDDFDTNQAKKWASSHGLTLRYSGYAVHISVNSEGKALGVRRLIQLSGLEREQVAAIGDSSTDIELLKEVGYPVALANSTQDLKESSIMITRSKSGKGVVEMVHAVLRERGVTS